jgi:hypothetical protein
VADQLELYPDPIEPTGGRWSRPGGKYGGLSCSQCGMPRLPLQRLCLPCLIGTPRENAQEALRDVSVPSQQMVQDVET